MTTVPPRPPIPAGRGKRHNPRTYSWWEWTRAYLALVIQLPFWLIVGLYAVTIGHLPAWMTRKLLRAHKRFIHNNLMDFRIPPDLTVPAYINRWWRLARNWAFNIYYHVVLRSDDDRALHDHPWMSLSIVLEGGYWEHTIAAGGIHYRDWCGPGRVKFRWHGKKAHRLELVPRHSVDDIIETRTAELPVKTIFITGPVLRRWGFHHETGWVDAYDWDRFCEERGIKGMRMDGGSDAVVSDRNKI